MRECLTDGFVLNNLERSFSIKGIIGEGSSCIAYDAVNLSTGDACIIKEYYPAFLLLHREDNGMLTCSDDQKKKFEEGKNCFKAATKCQIEIRNMADPINQIFPVIDHFECNGTVYTAVPKFSGKTYAENQNLTLYDRIRVCKSVTEYVSRCHTLGFLCLDIKPANIFILPETPELVMLFDFDSMRRVDDIQKGGLFSYTLEWAAPEQVIPSACANISRATDIYALGELLYWSVFNRHSTEAEHSRVSYFEYEKSLFHNDISDDAARVLTEIFHNTIRASHKNRYQTADELLTELQLLVMEVMPRKVKLLNVMPTMPTYFIGRDECLIAIEEKLHAKHVAILTGMGGIGKSELAKQFILKHQYDYKNIIFMTYSYDLQTMINETHFLSGCEQKDEESDEHYCERRVNLLHEMLPENSLLVIDNLNVELEEINQKHIWKKLSSIACDLIITSRCNQAMYEEEQIHVGELENNRLVELFLHYCPLEGESLRYVSDLIEIVQRHTLVLELVAKQVRFGIKTPEEMLKDLSGKGLLGLNENKVKWALENRTVADHVKTLFSMADMDDNKKSILFMMALMPVSGIDRKDFMAFFSFDNYETIRYLVDNGWVREKDNFLDIHPIIARIIVAESSEESKNDIYAAAIRTIINETIDKPFNRIGQSVALRTKALGIECLAAALYLVRYNGIASRYGNKLERLELLRYAVALFDSIFPNDEYVAIREYAFSRCVLCLMSLDQEGDVGEICIERIRIAKKHNDLYMQAVWLGILIETKAPSIQLFNIKDVLKEILPIVSLVLKAIIEQIKKKRLNKGQLSQDYLKKLHYYYMAEWNMYSRLSMQFARIMEEAAKYEEGDIFYDKELGKIGFYSGAIKCRSLCTNPNEFRYSSNNVVIHIDKAKQFILNRNYEDARKELLGIVGYFADNGIANVIELYQVHNMLGQIALIQKKYDIAVKEFDTSMTLADDFGIEKIYSTRILLARACALHGDIEQAKQYNKKILEDLEESDGYKKELYRAEVIYNTAIVYEEEGDFLLAIAYYKEADKSFDKVKSKNLLNHQLVGKARSLYRLSRSKMEHSQEFENANLVLALAYFNEVLGENHIETTKCRELLEEYKSRG
jgi:serine/threonine protein kinase/tetratricopeptide (TPR) repeat protein